MACPPQDSSSRQADGQQLQPHLSLFQNLPHPLASAGSHTARHNLKVRHQPYLVELLQLGPRTSGALPQKKGFLSPGLSGWGSSGIRARSGLHCRLEVLLGAPGQNPRSTQQARARMQGTAPTAHPGGKLQGIQTRTQPGVRVHLPA